MKVILSCTSTNEHFDGDCEYALIDLDETLARQILKRAELAESTKKADNDLQELQFWSYAPTWFSPHAPMFSEQATDEAFLNRVDEMAIDEEAEAPEGFEIPEHHLPRTECDQMVVTVSGSVFWTCYPKHADVTISTAYISLELVREAAGERKVA